MASVLYFGVDMKKADFYGLNAKDCFGRDFVALAMTQGQCHCESAKTDAAVSV